MLTLGFIKDYALEAITAMFLTIDSFIYSLIGSYYKIFMALASARLLSSETYEVISGKIYVIVGVVMLFVLAYAMLKSIVDPDQATKGDLGGPQLIKRILIAVLGLALAPAIFALLYQAQGLVLEKDILGQLFFRTGNDAQSFGSQSVGSQSVNMNNVKYNEMLNATGGGIAATYLWEAWFHPAEGYSAEEVVADPSYLYDVASNWSLACAAMTGIAVASAFVPVIGWGVTLLLGGAAALTCLNAVDTTQEANDLNELTNGEEITLQAAYNYTAAGEDFSIYKAFIKNVVGDADEDDGYITYIYFISAICGLLTAYCFVTFCIDMGIRAAKLAYYQIIAPVPITIQVLPQNKEALNKYIKEVVHTFIDVFIRISVVYIVVYIIANLPDLFSTSNALWGNSDLSTFEMMCAMALLIIGLILFSKQAPEMISSTFGGAKLEGGGLSLGKKIREARKTWGESGAGRFANTTAAAGYGAIKTGVRNFNKNIRDKDGHITAGKALTSALAGAASASARAYGGTYFSENGKAPVTLRDIKNTGDNVSGAAEDARDRRDAKEERYGSDTNNKWTNLKRNVSGTAGDVGDNIKTWATPTIDTTAEDAYVALMGKLDAKDTLRGKTGKDSAVQTAEQFLASVQANKPQEYNETAYQAAISAAAQTVSRTKVDGSTKTDAEYAADVKAATDSISRESFRNANYTAEVAAQADKTNAMKKLLESTQDDAFLRLAISGDAAARSTLQSLITDNLAAIKAQASTMMLDKNGNATGKTLQQVLEENLGFDIGSGKIEWSKLQAAAAKGGKVELKVDGVDLAGATSIDSKGVFKLDMTKMKYKVERGVDADGKAIIDEIAITDDVTGDAIASDVRDKVLKGLNITEAQLAARSMRTAGGKDIDLTSLNLDDVQETVANASRVSNVAIKNAITDAMDAVGDAKKGKTQSPDYVKKKNAQREQKKEGGKR